MTKRGTAKNVDKTLKTKNKTKSAKKASLVAARAKRAHKRVIRVDRCHMIPHSIVPNPPAAPATNSEPQALNRPLLRSDDCPVREIEEVITPPRKRLTKSALLEEFRRNGNGLSLVEFKQARARDRAPLYSMRYRDRQIVKKMKETRDGLINEWHWAALNTYHGRGGCKLSWSRPINVIERELLYEPLLKRKIRKRSRRSKLSGKTHMRERETSIRRQRRKFISEYTDRNYQSDKYYRAAFLDMDDLFRMALKRCNEAEDFWAYNPRIKGKRRRGLVAYAAAAGFFSRNLGVYKKSPYRGK